MLTTDRLTLRYFTTDDAPFLLKLLNSEGWIKYIGDRNVHTVADAIVYNKRFTDHYTAHGFGFYLVELTESQTPIGMCGLCRREGLPDADIGFAFLPEYSGKGYAYESAAACMIHARKDCNIATILGITVPYNEKSIRLLERIGLVFEKKLFMAGDDEELMLFSSNVVAIQNIDNIKKLKNPAVRALLEEYNRALIDLKNSIQVLDNEQLTRIIDAVTKDNDCRSVQTILKHVIRAGYGYAAYIERYHGETVALPTLKVVETATLYTAELDKMLSYNVAVFERYPNIIMEEHNISKKITTRWGQTCDVEQLMEHAICHILRHRRQIENWEPRLQSRQKK
jgi:RimJ/RimL family protein N-acetyltransferase